MALQFLTVYKRGAQPVHDFLFLRCHIFSNQENGSRTLFNFPGEKKDIEYKYPDEEVSVILSDGHETRLADAGMEVYGATSSGDELRNKYGDYTRACAVKD